MTSPLLLVLQLHVPQLYLYLYSYESPVVLVLYVPDLYLDMRMVIIRRKGKTANDDDVDYRDNI